MSPATNNNDAQLIPAAHLPVITQATELLSKPGFRKATEQEEINFRKAVLLQTPSVLRKLESKRLKEEADFLKGLEADDDFSAENTNVEDLLHAPVTDAQKTGALTPEQVATMNQGQTPDNLNPEVANTVDLVSGSSSPVSDTGSTDSTNKPPSRRTKTNTNNSSNTTKSEGTTSQDSSTK